MNTEFDHIPTLHEILGSPGTPGLVYAYVCIHNLRRAQREESLRPTHHRGQPVPYLDITGPLGTATICLMERGTPLPAAASASGKRPVMADPDILTFTGLNPNPDYLGTPTQDITLAEATSQETSSAEVRVETSERASRAPGPPSEGQDSQGDERVQKWEPSV